MRLHNSFELGASSDAAWALLLDVPRVIPCMPGAQLVETVGDGEWKARLATKLGPVNLGFDVDVVRESVDGATRTVMLSATARERGGRGHAQARIVNQLQTEGASPVAHITTDLKLTGAVARFGRQSLIQDVAAQMTGQFAANLRQELTGETAVSAPAAGPVAPDPPQAAAPPASRMIVGILLRSLIRHLERWLARVERT